MTSQQKDNACAQTSSGLLLLDIIGGESISVLHPHKPIVAYTAGCMIIVYDLISDAKIQLINHHHEVRALAFSGAGASTQGGEFLISIDFNKNDANGSAKMCLWEWSRGTCLQEAILPQSQLGNQLTDAAQFQIKFDRTGSMFMVV